MKINLGCGKRKLEGYINVDWRPEVNPDIVSDLRETPWLWANENQADLIWSDNFFEHIYPGPLLKVFQECHRVLKPNGLLQIKVPISAPDNYLTMYSDPMHVNHNFTTETYDYYDHRHKRWKNYGSVYGIPKFERVKQERKGRFLIVELKVIK